MVEFVLGFMAGAVICSILAIFLFRYILKQSQLGLSDSLEKGEQRLSQINADHLSNILSPMKDKLKDFQEAVEKTYSQESRERFSLQKQVELLKESNDLIGKEANNLTRALKGDVKLQGFWGETLLENILEKSGLCEGREFVLQGKGQALKDSAGNSFRPDVIVSLPNQSHVVIDSKVSLTHFIKFIESEDDKEQEEIKKQLKKSLQSHIDGLANKNYQNLEGINCPDFVFMFIPIEAAFGITLESFPEILDYSWKKNIVIATPSTLMASLRTVASIWKIEKQSQNAEEIAKKGALLYDKLVGFYDELHKVGESLEKAQKSYDGAMSKLQNGKGNLVDRAKELKELGINTTKTLS